MIKKFIDSFKKYFSFKTDKKRYLFAMLLTATIRSGVLLTFAWFGAQILEYVTLGLYDVALLFVGLFAVIFIIYDLACRANNIAYSLNANYVYLMLEDKVLDKISSYDDSAFKKISKSYLINTAISDIATVKAIPDTLIEIIVKFVTLAASIIILTRCNLLIGIIALILNLIYLRLYNYHNRRRDIYLKGQKRSQDKIADYFNQLLDGNKEIRTFDMEKDLNRKFNSILSGWSNNYMNKRKYHDRKETYLSAILRLGRFITYAIMILELAYGNIEVATLILVIGYYNRMENGNRDLRAKLNNISQDSVKLDRVHSLLNYNNETNMNFGDYAQEELFGNIEFDKVTFTYNDVKTLKNVSFEIESNSLVAIVGKSGSGKSTILKLLLRLYKPENGNIYIDGVNINEYGIEAYPKYVSIATQKPFIFNMSIKENLGLVNKNVDKQIEACKRVGIHDFLMSLPRKYNTVLKEDALDVSGGQKQLISLARTLLAESQVLLLDEVTSSLDPNTAKHITNLLKGFKNDHTVVMITHTPSQMKIADKIIVVDKGKIVGIGKHKELLKNNRYYQELQK